MGDCFDRFSSTIRGANSGQPAWLAFGAIRNMTIYPSFNVDIVSVQHFSGLDVESLQ